MNKINMTQKFILPRQHICRMYPIKAHSVILYILFSLQFYFFHHFDCQVLLFVLRFYGPVNPMGSCRARSVYLTTRLLGRLSPLSG